MEENKDNPQNFSELRRLAEKLLHRKKAKTQEKLPDDREKIVHELRVHQIELEMQNEELRKTQGELEESRNKYHNLYDFAPVGYLTLDKNGLIQEINLTGADLLGLERRYLMKAAFSRFIAPEDQQVFYVHRQKVFESRLQQSCELNLMKKDGTKFFAQLQCIAIEDDNGNFNGMRAAISDITRLKQTEEELKEYRSHLEDLLKKETNELLTAQEQLQKGIIEQRRSEESLRKSEESLSKDQQIAHLGSWEWNIETTEQAWSDEQFRIFGYEPGVMKPTYDHFLEALHPDDRDRFIRAVQDAIEGTKPYEIEFRIIRSDKTRRTILAQGGVLRDEHDKPVRMVGTVLDITERKQTERNLEAALSEIKELKDQLEAERAYLQDEIKSEYNHENIIGQSDEINYVLYKVEQIARTDTNVLILGETGTGKELVARAIHSLSSRKDRALMKINCAALPSTLIESELFGHEKGAFTGAHVKQLGRFEVANGANLFLDEIGELPMELQPKLLRVIQDGEFERLGSSHTIKVNVRIIAATNRNLEEEVRRGRFREDLWFRLNIFPITMPPLRDRLEDIPLLVDFYVNKICKKLGKSIESIPTGVMNALQNYHWPGNVREMENVLERAVINSSGPKLHLVDELKKPSKDLTTTPKTMEAVERDHIVRVLEQTHWKVSGKNGATEILGLNRSTLRARMRKLGIREP
jgi:PAS domain S-box-containing protein